MSVISNISMEKQFNSRLKRTVCLLLVCFFITPGLFGEIVVDRIVAQVNDDIITLSDLNSAIEPYVEKIKAMNKPPQEEQEMLYKVRTEMLDELISNKLADQVVREKGINVSEGDIDNAIESIKRKNRMTDEQFRKALEEEGATMAEYRSGIREQMLRSRLMNQEVQSKIVITTEDIEAYYNEHSEKYGSKQKYHLRTIIKRIPQFADKKKVNSIVATMEEIIEKLDKGESFSELAKANSDLLAEEGGDIGSFEINQLSEEIRPAVKDLKVGAHTPVIDTAQGLQIFYLEEMLQTEGVPLDSVSDDIKDILYDEIVDQKFKEFIGDLREKAHIKIVQ